MKYLFLSLCLILYTFSIYSQEQSQEARVENNNNKRFYLGIEAFGGFVDSYLKEDLEIRQNIEPYNINSYKSIHTESSTFSFGIKPEFRFAKRWSITSGVKYTRTNASINGIPVFYFRYKTEGINTYYAKINNFSEHYDFIGVPLELKYFAFQHKYIAMFIKIGLDFNYKFNSKINIEFSKESMNNSEQEVLDNLDLNTNSFYSSFYHSVGLRIAKDDRPNINLEIIMPSLYITNDYSSFVDPYLYFGFKISLILPLTNKN